MHFDSWQESVEYYKRWQNDNYTNPKENYYGFLLRVRYARTPDYVRVLKQIKLSRDVGAPLKTKTPPKKSGGVAAAKTKSGK